MGALDDPIVFAFPEKAGTGAVFAAGLADVLVCARLEADADDTPARTIRERKIPIRRKGSGFTWVFSLKILVGVF
jgi:hypothetical protein